MVVKNDDGGPVNICRHIGKKRVDVEDGSQYTIYDVKKL